MKTIYIDGKRLYVGSNWICWPMGQRIHYDATLWERIKFHFTSRRKLEQQVTALLEELGER